MKIMFRHLCGAALLSFAFAACAPTEPPKTAAPLTEAQTQALKRLSSAMSCSDLDALTEAVNAAPDLSDFQRYKLEAQANVCSLDVKTPLISDAVEVAKIEGLSAVLDGDTLRIMSVSATDSAPQLCCSISHANWVPVGLPADKVWAAQFRVKQAERARLMFLDLGQADADGKIINPAPIQVRGPAAVEPDLPFLSDPNVATQGTVEVTELFSPELRETRKLTIYRPRTDATDLPVLILGDGMSLGYFVRMIDPMITHGTIRPITALGVHSGSGAISKAETELPQDPRATDYLPGFQDAFPDRFEQHMRFVFNTALPAVAGSEMPQVVVAGHSNAAVFALYAGLQNLERVDAVLAVSAGFGGLKDTPNCKGVTTDFQLSAGLYEPAFLASSQVSAELMTAAGCQVSTHWDAVGHDSAFFQAELHRFLIEQFGQ